MKPVAEMTLQEIFDHVVAHLRKQGQQSLPRQDDDTPTMCRYRTDDGLKCAIGCLIPDERYMPHLEGRGGRSPAVLHALGLPQLGAEGYDDKKVQLLSSLQNLHDGWPTKEWENGFEMTAGNYDLDYTKPHSS